MLVFSVSLKAHQD